MTASSFLPGPQPSGSAATSEAGICDVSLCMGLLCHSRILTSLQTGGHLG